MSFETIGIVRTLNIINGFVQLPNNLEKDRSRVSLAAYLALFPSTKVGRLSAGTGGARLAGSKHGLQEFIELPVSVVDCCRIEPGTSSAQCAKRIFGTTQPTDSPVYGDRPVPTGDNCYVPEGYTDYPRDQDDPDVPYTPPAAGNSCECLAAYRAGGEYYGIYVMMTLPSTVVNSVCMCAGGEDLEAGVYTLAQIGDCNWGLETKYYTFRVWYDTANCKWFATITCGRQGVWRGELIGAIPSGVWTTVSGCASSAIGSISSTLGYPM